MTSFLGPCADISGSRNEIRIVPTLLPVALLRLPGASFETLLSTDAFSPGEIEKILTSIDAQDHWSALNLSVSNVCDELVAASEARFHEIIHRKWFRDGVLFGSLSCYRMLMDTDPPRLLFSSPRKVRKLFLALSRYLTRACTRATPFGSFSMVALVTADHETPYRRFSADGLMIGERQSHVRLNNAIFSWLRTMIVGNRELIKHLPVALNPNITHLESGYRLFANSEGRDRFYDIPRNRLLDLLSELPADTLYTISSLSALITSKLGDSGQSIGVEAFLSELFAIGAIEVQLGGAEYHAHWPVLLQSVLSRSLPPNSARECIVGTLRCIVSSSSQIALADTSTRHRLITQLHDLFVLLADLIVAYPHPVDGIEGNPLSANAKIPNVSSVSPNGLPVNPVGIVLPVPTESIVREDVVLARPLDIGQAALEDVVRDLGRLSSLIRSHGHCDGRLIECFLAAFPAQSSIPILDVFRVYLQSPGRDIPKKLSLSSITPLPSSQDKGLYELQYTYDQIAGIYSDHSPDFREHAGTYNAVIQPEFKYNDGEEYLSRFFLQSLGIGYGTKFARYLPYYPEHYTSRYRGKLDEFDDDLVEIKDSCYCPTTDHPPIARSYIRLPGAESGDPDQQELSLADLHVRYNPNGEYLYTWNAIASRPVRLIAYGHQVPVFRSAFFQFLMSFMGVPVPDLTGLLQVLNTDKPHPVTDGVRLLPRIVIDNRIVIQRRAWIVSREYFNHALRTASGPAERCIAADIWRRLLGLPASVFVRALHHKGASSTKLISVPSQRKALKPLYVSFGNHLQLANLVAMSATAEELVFEEVFPEPNNCLRINGEHYNAQVIVEWGAKREMRR